MELEFAPMVFGLNARGLHPWLEIDEEIKKTNGRRLVCSLFLVRFHVSPSFVIVCSFCTSTNEYKRCVCVCGVCEEQRSCVWEVCNRCIRTMRNTCIRKRYHNIDVVYLCSSWVWHATSREQRRLHLLLLRLVAEHCFRLSEMEIV